MNHIYDCCIVGAGPAGMTAAIYGKRACLDLLILDKGFLPGGQIAVTGEVDNYPGFPGISGADLGMRLSEHGEKFGVSVVREEIQQIKKENAGIFTIVSENQEYQARTILLATGASHRPLGVPGEEELQGMGVSYCAVCDGAFYKDAVTAVVGGGNTALEDALFLAGICKKVYLIHRREEFRGDKLLQKKLLEKENVEILRNTIVQEICGEDETEGILVKNKQTGEEQYISLEGVFIAVGMLPNTEMFRGLVSLDENGYIIAGEDGKTETPGVFAAGDLRTKKLRQVVTAVSDGANSVSSVQHYLLKTIDSK